MGTIGNSKDNRIVEDSYSFMKKIASRKNYESKETKIIYPTEFSILKADNKQRCWASDLRAVITPGGMYRCTYARGKYSMPLPESAEEFIKNRNILNEEFVCNDACFFCTRFKLNVVVDELIGNPGYLKSMVDSCIDEEIEDEEWI